MHYHEHVYRQVRVVLDGNQFTNCRFDSCELVFCGGKLPELRNCFFDGRNIWTFDCQAMNTLRFLREMYHGLEDGATNVEALFEQIRAK